MVKFNLEGQIQEVEFINIWNVRGISFVRFFMKFWGFTVMVPAIVVLVVLAFST